MKKLSDKWRPFEHNFNIDTVPAVVPPFSNATDDRTKIKTGSLPFTEIVRMQVPVISVLKKLSIKMLYAFVID
jgi:hypothetical protein